MQVFWCCLQIVVACVAAITEKGQPARNPMLCRIYSFSQDEKSDWFKMKKYANLC